MVPDVPVKVVSAVATSVTKLVLLISAVVTTDPALLITLPSIVTLVPFTVACNRVIVGLNGTNGAAVVEVFTVNVLPPAISTSIEIGVDADKPVIHADCIAALPEQFIHPSES